MEIASVHLVQLNHSNPQFNFIVTAINDNILEDYEESFHISISIENPSVVTVINTTELEIIIKDNDGNLHGFRNVNCMMYKESTCIM